jgi:hypothetical protein
MVSSEGHSSSFGPRLACVGPAALGAEIGAVGSHAAAKPRVQTRSETSLREVMEAFRLGM